ncbi:hypothetical protein PR048_014158 [Dryococelus australis]|uniref:Uncharacterized protein n=1 Tax=Dryococelus australis TaxID=614101 RepID=A0ABQ9HDJ2_9NEOP|nr:hypothetical protein PR048_014158 [Dryococelus australis]
MPNDAAGRRAFSGMSRFPRTCIPALPHRPYTRLASPLSTNHVGAVPMLRILRGPVKYENAFSSRQQPMGIYKLMLGAYSIEVHSVPMFFRENSLALAYPLHHHDSVTALVNYSVLKECFFRHSAVETMLERSTNRKRFGRLLTTMSLEPMGRIEVSMEKRRNGRARKQEIPEKTRQPVASSGTIPTHENPGVARPGIEPASPWWEASRRTAQDRYNKPTRKQRFNSVLLSEVILAFTIYYGTKPGSTFLYILEQRSQYTKLGHVFDTWRPKRRKQPNKTFPGGLGDCTRRGRCALAGMSRRNPVESLRQLQPVMKVEGIIRDETLQRRYFKQHNEPENKKEPSAIGRNFQMLGKINAKFALLFEDILNLGAMAAERLARSPPTKVSRVQSPAGSPDFCKWESCRTMPLVGGFSRGSSVFPAPSLRRCSIFTPIPSSALKTSLLRAAQISSLTHILNLKLFYLCNMFVIGQFFI